MESEQYVFVMRRFLNQSKFQAPIKPHLVHKTIQPDTLTNHFCTR